MVKENFPNATPAEQEVVKMRTSNPESSSDQEKGIFDIESLKDEIINLILPKDKFPNLDISSATIVAQTPEQITLQINFTKKGFLKRKGNIEIKLGNNGINKQLAILDTKIKTNEDLSREINIQIHSLPENLKSLLIQQTGRVIYKMHITNGEIQATFLNKKNGNGNGVGNHNAIADLHPSEEGVVRGALEMADVQEIESQRRTDILAIPRVREIIAENTALLESKVESKKIQASENLKKFINNMNLSENVRSHLRKRIENYRTIEDEEAIRMVEEIDKKYDAIINKKQKNGE